MSAPSRIPAVPAVLEWARKSAGLSIEVAAKRIGISGETLEKWESSVITPTIRQLRKAAKLYRRPLAVLLLPNPPKDFDAMRDFRRLSGDSVGEWSAALHSEFKRAASQREVFLELDELAPASVQATDRTLSLTRETPPEEAGAAIRGALAIDLSQQSWTNPREALNSWIAATESLGILVIHTRRIGVSEMRGFAISEWPHPVIALNGSDSPRARIFTLAHELCHLALNAGGLCDLHEWRGARTPTDDLEHYCNRVGASVLMPADLLLAERTVKNADRLREWTIDELGMLARRFGTSSEALLLRLISLDRATWDLYSLRKPELEHEYETAREREREERRESPGGPSYYVVKARDLGHGYVVSVLEAFRSRSISSLDVADYLDIRYDQLSKLEKVVLR